MTSERRYQEDDKRSEELIDRLDAFLLRMQDVADRLIARLDEEKNDDR